MHGGQRGIPAASCKRLLRARLLAVRVLLLALLLAGACPAVAQQDPSSAAAANADAAVRANDEVSEVDALALLRALEVKLSLSAARGSMTRSRSCSISGAVRHASNAGNG